MSPLIALAGRYGAHSRVSRDAVAFAGRRYLDAILRAGGEPVVISPQPLKTKDAEAMMQRFDGLVLMGGADVNPILYGQVAGVHVYGGGKLVAIARNGAFVDGVLDSSNIAMTG